MDKNNKILRNNKIINDIILDNKIRVSALTASKLGLIKIKSFGDSKQAYLMFGTKCLFSCSFCAQSINAKSSANLLSRVTWPSFDLDLVISAFKNKLKDNPDEFKKICFQVVTIKDYFNRFLKVLKKFKEEINLPVSTSISIFSIKQADILFQNGVYSIGFAIDVSSKRLYYKIKKRNYYKDKELLLTLGRKYPDRISLHVIAGLGENDREFLELIKDALLNNIIISLFAFTPVHGTEMEKVPKLSISRYRKLQFIIALMKKDNPEVIFNDLIFDENNNIKKLNNFEKYYKKYNDYFNKGTFLMTLGCPYCNRPYYNDKPGDKRLYNYHFIPPKDIVVNELSELVRFFQTD